MNMRDTIVLALAAAVGVFALTLTPAPAYAQGAPTGDAQDADVAKVEKLYAEGVALYKQDKHRAAIAKFEEAYAIFPDPNLLYNIGRSHELLGELDKALASFEKCLASSDASAQLRGKVQERIAIIQEAKKEAARAKAQADNDKGKGAANAGAKTGGKTDGASGGGGKTQSDGGGLMRPMAWTSAIASVGLVGTGGVFFFLGASDHGEIDDAIGAGGVAPLTRREAEELAQSGEDNKTLGVALMGTGLAVGVVSVLLFALDDSDDEATLSVAPMPLQGGGAVSLGGTF